MKILLTHTKSTKGTHVYANENLGITNIYLPKSLQLFADKEEAPKTITMTLEAK